MKDKILIVLPTVKFLHRQILEGVLAYAREHGPWQFHLVTGDRFEQGLRHSSRWGFTGAIVLTDDKKRVKSILDRGVPTVLLNAPATKNPHERTCLVRRNQEDVGKTAAEYFIDRGFSSFAFVADAQPATWEERRLKGFKGRLAHAGYSCSTYAAFADDGRQDFDVETDRLCQWISGLPPGTGVYVVRDNRALQVLGACMDAGIRVPHDIAVLGTDNDEALCESATPSLSSIALDGMHTGTLCAHLLEALMLGIKTEPIVDLAMPRVITRASTDTLALADPVLAKVLGHVRANLAQPVKIRELAATFGYSRRTLEMKAQKEIGRTLKDEINRIRLNEAIRLLSNTSLSVQAVAEQCGFCCASHLGTRLKAAFGHPPSVFRYRNPA